jgi:hypothetical protein
MADEFPKTLSIPEAGKRYFGLSRNRRRRSRRHSDDKNQLLAAAVCGAASARPRGLLRVPVRALERMLDKVTDTDSKDAA